MYGGIWNNLDIQTDFFTAINAVLNEFDVFGGADSVRNLVFSYTLGTVQHQLMQILVGKRKQELSSVLTPIHRAWWRSTCNVESGQWLEMIPATQIYCISNEKFKTSLRYRVYLKAPNYVDGLHCSCKS